MNRTTTNEDARRAQTRNLAEDIKTAEYAVKLEIERLAIAESRLKLVESRLAALVRLQEKGEADGE